MLHKRKCRTFLQKTFEHITIGRRAQVSMIIRLYGDLISSNCFSFRVLVMCTIVHYHIPL